MSDSKKTIIIFSAYHLPHTGGVEVFTGNLANELSNNGYKVVIVSSDYAFKNSPISSHHNITQILLPIYKPFSSRLPIPKQRASNRLLKPLLEENICGVICNTRFFLTSRIGARFAHENNLPVMVIEHGSSHISIGNRLFDFLGAKLEHFLTRSIKKNVSSFYGVSKECSNWLKHFGIKSSGEVYNSINASEFDTYKNAHYIKNKKGIVITYAGRLLQEKGLPLLAEAFGKLSQEHDNVYLYIAGDGPYENELRTFSQKNKNVKLLGRLSHEDVMKLYNDTDIFVYPSMYPEGLPTSIIEAGLMKCAVVATDRGGTKEVIQDNTYGIIVDENTNSVLDGINYILNDQKYMKKIQENIHNRVVTSFNWKTTAKKIIKELENGR